jgi:hypothetical protein
MRGCVWTLRSARDWYRREDAAVAERDEGLTWRGLRRSDRREGLILAERIEERQHLGEVARGRVHIRAVVLHDRQGLLEQRRRQGEIVRGTCERRVDGLVEIVREVIAAGFWREKEEVGRESTTGIHQMARATLLCFGACELT